MALSRMHDIAGCRLIFPDLDVLKNFRDSFLSGRASHILIGGKDKYDYITNPKPSGYRGIHDVYKYDVKSSGGQKWNGLRIEIQYRTTIQHAWSTAVEISDIVNSTRLKFSESNQSLQRLFLLASEILCRANEDMFGFCKEIPTKELIEEFNELENSIHAVGRLRNLISSKFQKFVKSYKLFILINYTSGNRDGESEVEGFSDNLRAVTRYSELEKNLEGVADVVLVGAAQQDSVKLAYTNYFLDADYFVEILDDSIKRLVIR